MRILPSLTRTLTGAVVISAAIVLAPLTGATPAQAATLSKGGVTLKAPAGYTLARPAANGPWRLSGKGITAWFFRVSASKDLAALTASYRAATPGAGPATGGRFTVTRGASRQTVVIRAATGAGAAAGQFDIVRVGVRARATGKRANAARLRPPTAAELNTVLGILGRRTAQPVVALAAGIPLKTCVAPDGGSRAQIPDLPGSACDGSQGSFTTAKEGYGAATLGIPFYVSTVPLAGGTPITGTWSTPEQGVREIFPQVARTYFGATVENLSTVAVPGSDGVIAGVPSGLVAFHARIGGREFDGLMLSAYLDASTGGATWLWYTSYVLVDATAPAGTGDAYLTTWRTWDARAAVRDRLADIANTIRSTAPAGGPIDPDAFQRAADDWGAYIAG